jgi:hypothetical protein
MKKVGEGPKASPARSDAAVWRPGARGEGSAEEHSARSRAAGASTAEADARIERLGAKAPAPFFISLLGRFLNHGGIALAEAQQRAKDNFRKLLHFHGRDGQTTVI